MRRHRLDAGYRQYFLSVRQLLCLAACLGALAALPARAGVLRLTQSTAPDLNPRINSAGQVVWEAYDGHDTEIFLWNGGSVQQLTDNDRNDYGASLNDAGQVAWGTGPPVWDTGPGDLSFWDGASVRVIAHNTSNDSQPQLNQAGQIAWIGIADDGSQIFLWDGAAVRQLSHSFTHPFSPRLNNRGQIVWLGDALGNISYVYLWDGTSVRFLGNARKEGDPPQINDAGQVVWHGQSPDGLRQWVYLWDRGNLRILAELSLSQYNRGASPQINRAGQVVWKEVVEGAWALFLWDGTTIRTLKGRPGEPAGLQINNTGQVLWKEWSSIYRWDGAALEQIARYETRENPPLGVDWLAQNDAGQIVWAFRGELYRYTPPVPGSLDLSPAPVVGSDPSTGRVMLNSPAPAGGTVVSLTSSDLAVAEVPPSVTVPPGATMATFPVPTRPVAATRDIVLTAKADGATWTATLKVWAFTLDAIQLRASSVPGGEGMNGTLRFQGVAPEAGAAVVLTSDHPEIAAPVTASVSVAPGTNQAAFEVRTTPITAPTPVTLTATYGGLTRRISLLVKAFGLAEVDVSPDRIRGRVSPGDSTNGYVNLEAPPRQADVVVTLSHDHPEIMQMPVSVRVTRYSASAGFPIRVAPVVTPTTVQIIASYEGVSRTALLQVEPATLDQFKLKAPTISGGVTTYGEVEFAGEPPAGSRVAVSTERPDVIQVPSEFEVPPGQSYLYFPIATRPVATTTRARVFVSFHGQKQAAWLTLTPVRLSSLTLVAAPRLDLDTALAVLALNEPAPAGGAKILVQQARSNGEIRHDFLTVPAGASLLAAQLPLITSDAQHITALFGGDQIAARWQWYPLESRPGGTQIIFPQSWVVGGHPLLGTLRLPAPAPAGGATLRLDNSDPSVLGIPESVTVPAGQESIDLPIGTFPVSTDTLVTISVHGWTVGRVWVLPPGVLSVSLDASRVIGGRSVMGTVTLTESAPAVGRRVPLFSADPSVTTAPSAVVVPAGATIASFPVTTAAVAAPTRVAIIAAGQDQLRVGTITLLPPSLGAVTLSPWEIRGGEAAAGTVTLSDPAPAGGLVIQLQTDNLAYCVLPETVVVPPGVASATFPVRTDLVPAPTSVQIIARLGDEFQKATLTLRP
jgi:hypothetical protein